MTTNRKWLLIKVLPYPLLALLGGWIYAVLERGIMGDTNFYPSTGNPYHTLPSVISVTVMTLVLGFVLGLLEESWLKSRMKLWPFFLKLITKTFLYLLLIILLLFVAAWITNSYNIGASMFDPAVLQTLSAFFLSFTLLSIVIYAGAVISSCLFVAEIIDYLGLDVVGNFFTGHYNKAVEEDRVFMFLDMTGSTTIAEQLGNKAYYELINQYYADMTGPIVGTKGQIYQYVGDEIVISWKMADGIDQSHCLQCFDAIATAIQDNAALYLERYGLIPQFKAGIHAGSVTRGQVGLIKKEMLFTGDVLNTTARIQGLCHELQSNLLISASLKGRLPMGNYHFESKGSFKLRGRKQKEELFAVVTQ